MHSVWGSTAVQKTTCCYNTYTYKKLVYAFYDENGRHYLYKVYESVLQCSDQQPLLPSVVDFALAMTTPQSFVEVCGIGVGFMWTVLVRSITIKGSMIQRTNN